MKLNLSQIRENLEEDIALWTRNINRENCLTEKGKQYAQGRIEAHKWSLYILRDLEQ